MQGVHRGSPVWRSGRHRQHGQVWGADESLLAEECQRAALVGVEAGGRIEQGRDAAAVALEVASGAGVTVDQHGAPLVPVDPVSGPGEPWPRR